MFDLLLGSCTLSLFSWCGFLHGLEIHGIPMGSSHKAVSMNIQTAGTIAACTDCPHLLHMRKDHRVCVPLVTFQGRVGVDLL